jgi:hypothetical protein
MGMGWLVNSISLKTQSPMAAQPGIVTGNNQNILYWLQLSDIHINEKEPEITQAFAKFVNETIPTISPNFVIATGDTVDGEHPDKNGQHHQSLGEYEIVRSILDSANFPDGFFRFTIGNHEKYDTINDSPFFTYFENDSNYVITVNTTFGLYRFVVIDTTPEIGLVNYYNLWGVLTTERLNIIEELLANSASPWINQTIFMGHHPLENLISAKSASGKNFEQIMASVGAVAYLNGHIHQEKFYRVKDGLIEIMAPAFKENGIYRICALDNDIFAFNDITSAKWPAVVLTNPIDHQFYTNRMPLNRMQTDTQIRALIFDPSPIEKAEIFIDGMLRGNMTYTGDNVYGLNYNPADFNTGRHTLRLVVTSASGSSEQEITFNIGNLSPDKSFRFGAAVLNFPIRNVMIGAFIFLWILNIIPFVVPKIWQTRNPGKELIFRSKFGNSMFGRWGTAAKLPFSSMLLLLIIPMFVLVGPIIIAPVVQNIVGYHFLYGMLLVGEGYSQWMMTLDGPLYPAILLLANIWLQGFVLHRTANPKSRYAWFLLLLSLGAGGGIAFLIAKYFGFETIFWNPSVLWYFVVLVLSIFRGNTNQ